MVLQPNSGPPVMTGVTVKTWNIFLVDDGLEENHETFRVQLKTPQNAVLGQRTSATVEILDPRRGGSEPLEVFCLYVMLVWNGSVPTGPVATCGRTCLEPSGV